MASDVIIDLVICCSSKRGAGVDTCIACFVKSIVHYHILADEIMWCTRSPVCFPVVSERISVADVESKYFRLSQFLVFAHEGFYLIATSYILPPIRVIGTHSITELYACNCGCWVGAQLHVHRMPLILNGRIHCLVFPSIASLGAFFWSTSTV